MRVLIYLFTRAPMDGWYLTCRGWADHRQAEEKKPKKEQDRGGKAKEEEGDQREGKKKRQIVVKDPKSMRNKAATCSH